WLAAGGRRGPRTVGVLLNLSPDLSFDVLVGSCEYVGASSGEAFQRLVVSLALGDLPVLVGAGGGIGQVGRSRGRAGVSDLCQDACPRLGRISAAASVPGTVTVCSSRAVRISLLRFGLRRERA